MTSTPTILVTGGAGFIGGHIAEQASADGWRVRVLDTFRTDVHPADATAPEGVEVVRGDVTDPDAVAAALEGVEVVSHQAAKVGLGVDFDDAPDYVRTNELGTAVLLAGMRRAGVGRLVLASSMVVYGEGRYRDADAVVAAPPRALADLAAGRFDPVSPVSGDPLLPALVDEDAPLDPRNLYAASKVAQENLVRIWARETGGRAAILRYHNVYGPRMPQATPYAGVASLWRSALERGDPPRVFEDGRQRRDFVHVADVARANLAAVTWTEDAASGAARAFNVASGDPHTIGEMAAALAEAFGGPGPVITGEYRAGDVRHVTASAARAARELGFTAGVSFDDGMHEFARAPLRAPAARGSA